MWIPTTNEFFSAVEDRYDDTTLFIRARVQADVQCPADALDALLRPRCRRPISCVQQQKAAWSACVASIDCDTCKRAVAERQGSRPLRTYGEVWSVLQRPQDIGDAKW